MKLALSDADLAFRDELREFFTAKFPADIRERARNENLNYPEDVVTSMRILNEAGLAVPNWPVEWGGKDWTPLQRQIWAEEMRMAVRPRTAGVQRAHGRPGDRAVRLPGDSRSASCPPPPTSTSGGARAFPSRRQARTWRRCAPPRSATATTTSSTARRPGPHWDSSPTGSSCWPAPTRTRPKKQAGHLLHPRRDEHPGHHRAPDQADRRQLRGQRGVVRGRPGPGGPARRRGERRLELREVPAVQ